MYGSTGETAASLYPVHADVNSDAICTPESSTVHSIDLQARTRDQQRYRQVSESLYFLYSRLASISLGKSPIHHATTYLQGFQTYYHFPQNIINKYHHVVGH